MQNALPVMSQNDTVTSLTQCPFRLWTWTGELPCKGHNPMRVCITMPVSCAVVLACCVNTTDALHVTSPDGKVVVTFDVKDCVDFAAEHNLQYVEFDAGWYGDEHTNESDATTVTVDPKSSSWVSILMRFGLPKERRSAPETAGSGEGPSARSWHLLLYWRWSDQ